MFNILFFLHFLLLPFVLAAQGLNCPDNGVEVSLPNPTAAGEIKFCQVNVDGIPKKHGPFVYVDDSGKRTKTICYRYGTSEDCPPEFKPVGLPGLSETHEVFLKNDTANSDVKIACPGVDPQATLKEALAPILQTSPVTQTFLAHGCRNYREGWLAYFVQGAPKIFNYEFNKACNVQGPIIAQENRMIDVSLNLQHLSPFDAVKMRLKFDLAMTDSIQVKLTILSGTLESACGKSEFTGDYSVAVMLSGQMKDNGQGQLKFSTLFDKPTMFTAPVCPKGCEGLLKKGQ